ncbi:GDP-mannose 4,6-dehydratase [Hymenobacter sp. HD11105]
MHKVLITGASGFVGKYLIEALSTLKDSLELVCISRNPYFQFPSSKNLKIKVINADLNNYSALDNLFIHFKPDSVFHLASDSSVSHSWESPIESFLNNTNIFLNLVESLRKHSMSCRILSIGSSEEYGLVNPTNIPLNEDSPLNPISPYAVARVSQELLSKVYYEGYGMSIIMTRSFNHIGPGQRDAFVISSFAKQIVEFKMGKHVNMQVGNINIIRDFLDVRDVVKAYIGLMKFGQAGNIYNICSGRGYTLKEIIKKMQDIAEVSFSYEINSDLLRPSDNPIIVGDNNKIRNAINWEPSFTIEQSLTDIIKYWESKIL